jgi:twitching motility protein PilT
MYGSSRDLVCLCGIISRVVGAKLTRVAIVTRRAQRRFAGLARACHLLDARWMSAIRSLLRVMTLREAEAIVLEPGKVPSLRRRGMVEALAMPALDAHQLSEFAAHLIDGKELPLTAAFADPDGGVYQCSFERTPAGIKLVARIAKAPPKPAAPPPATKPASAPPPAAVVAPVTHDTTEARHRLGRLLTEPVATARERGASDIFLSTGQGVRLRIDGRIEPLDLAFDDSELAACVTGLGANTDHSLELEGTRLRVNAFDHLHGYALAARLIRTKVPTLAELQLPAELGALVDHRDGLVLVCGPTGSGKSTTLAALLEVLDSRRAAHVITIEDPIEYRFTPRRCLIHQRELGEHVPTFAAGLRAALREAPDVILLGELRDRETIAAALTAAETGHLVLATLHAPSAAGAIDRVIDVFPEAQQRQIRWQLAGVLRTVVTQYLLPRRDHGRVVAYEVVPVTPAVANIMRKGDLHTLPTAIQSGREAGMIPLERSLARLIDSGVVAPGAVKRIAADHDLLASLSAKLR